GYYCGSYRSGNTWVF
nr:immunoglobulin light chain junction region [Macaca mulatta]MOW02906.1 immunoglobulin light chain junction region [Macaca mulatta]MOW03565.1 immunoglobulin light chain junction region [Macaca mulatta]